MIEFIKITETQYLIQENEEHSVAILGYLIKFSSSWSLFVDKQTANIIYTNDRLEFILNKMKELNAQ